LRLLVSIAFTKCTVAASSQKYNITFEINSVWTSLAATHDALRREPLRACSAPSPTVCTRQKKANALLLVVLRMCERTGAAASVERRRREPAKVIDCSLRIRHPVKMTRTLNKRKMGAMESKQHHRRVPKFWTYDSVCCACAQRPGLPRACDSG
jgi:hypothetical protein